MSKEQDAVFFRTFALVILGLVVFTVVVLLAARSVGQKQDIPRGPDTAEAQRIQPVGQVRLEGEADPTAAPGDAEPAAPTVAAADDEVGKRIYDSACMICHDAGVAGAPKTGDEDGWAPRLTQGMDTLYKHAIEGFAGEAGVMPPKGGRPDLSDDEVKAAVDYMVVKSGGEAGAGPAAPEVGEATAAAGRGQDVYQSACFICHDGAMPGAPKTGDSGDWAPRIAQGMETLYDHAINGFVGDSGMLMPARGGRDDLSDDEVRAAVDYMVDASR